MTGFTRDLISWYPESEQNTGLTGGLSQYFDCLPHRESLCGLINVLMAGFMESFC